jgi:hypothetical protein
MPDAPADAARWADVLAHAEAIYKHITESTPSHFEVAPVTLRIVMIFWRAVRLYDAVIILLKAQLPEEAAILVRSLIEVSLHLRQLQAEPENRTSLVYGWLNSSITEQEGLLKHCEKNEAVTKGEETLKRRRQDIAKEFSQLGIPKPLKFLDRKVAAKRYGRSEEEILFYQWSHESVHGSEAAWMFARKDVGEGTVGVFGKTGNPRILSLVVHFAARSMTDAAEAMFAIMGWQFPAAVKEGLAQIERVLG